MPEGYGSPPPAAAGRRPPGGSGELRSPSAVPGTAGPAAVPAPCTYYPAPPLGGGFLFPHLGALIQKNMVTIDILHRFMVGCKIWKGSAARCGKDPLIENEKEKPP